METSFLDKVFTLAEWLGAGVVVIIGALVALGLFIAACKDEKLGPIIGMTVVCLIFGGPFVLWIYAGYVLSQ